MAFDADKENAKQQKANEKAAKEAKEATAKKIEAQAKQTVTEAKQRVSDAKDDLSTAKSAVKDAEKTIKNLQKQYDNSVKERADLEEKLQEEKERLANMMANSKDDGTGQKLYSKEQIEAQRKKVEEAQQAYDAEDSNLNGIITQLQTAKSILSAKQEQQTEAETALAAAQENLKGAEENYKKVKQQISSGDLEAAADMAEDGEKMYGYDGKEDDQEIDDDGEDGTVIDENGVAESDQPLSATDDNAIAPFDVRLIRSDLFLYGEETIPFSSDEASGILADLIEYQQSGTKGHAAPRNEKQYGIVSNDPNNYGLLSLINPYSTTRLYNGININLQSKYVSASENRMLDIRDQKRFYDIKKINGNEDPLTVSNPTTQNIIQIMCNDRWGRTPYTYQDFVFCKYWNRIPNNRLITLRKYAAPTYDNLCWEMMGHDKNQLMTKFAPIATACTFFGGESGNSLKDLFKITSGLNWEEIGAEIWNVTGDSGESQQQVADTNLNNGGTNGMSTGSNIINSMFNFNGKMLANAGSLLKFLGAAKNPAVFSGDEANAQKFYENLHDPNDSGPYANRIQGPLNRINSVMKRKEGIKFDHKITLKFSYKARPIGGVNTKAAMLDILANMLLLCSASAVFWGGGHKFMITPHAYPWHVPNADGFLKAVYNGQMFGQNGAIAQALHGVAKVGSSDSNSANGTSAFSLENVTNFLKSIGGGVLGAFGGALNALVGTLNGAGLSTISEYVKKGQEYLQSSFGNMSGFATGSAGVSNLLKTTQDVWKSNSVKETVLPYVEGMRALLLGTPVGNWHLTVGNPLNPIAVIGNLICEDISFEFGEELGPDDFPDELDCTVTLSHGMPRDLAGIESMFNRGAGRIYQAPDYMKMWGVLPSDELETRVDKMTGGTNVRVPHKFMAVEGKASSGKYYSSDTAKSSKLSNSGSVNYNMQTINQNNVIDYNRGYGAIDGTTTGYSRKTSTVRAFIAGNMHTRHYVDS